MTQTANVAACPGKCIHALASLMCDTVLEEVKSPKIYFFFDEIFIIACDTCMCDMCDTVLEEVLRRKNYFFF